jgi:predicted ATPase
LTEDNPRIVLVTSPGWAYYQTLLRTLNEWWVANGKPTGAVLISSQVSELYNLAEKHWQALGGQIEHRMPDALAFGDRAWRIRNIEVAHSRPNYALAFVWNRNVVAEHYVERLRREGVPVQALLVE